LIEKINASLLATYNLLSSFGRRRQSEIYVAWSYVKTTIQDGIGSGSADKSINPSVTRHV
jgi:hypothetical protein